MMNYPRIGIFRALGITSESGVTAIEYGLIAALVALAIIAGITLVGTNLSGLFSYIGGKLVVREEFPSR